MSGPIYFICSTPGSSGNSVVRLFRTIIEASSVLEPVIFLQTPPAVMTPEFWFENIDPGANQVVRVPYRPDYAKLKERFPGCKIVVVTHLLPECTTIALTLWEDFYKDAYEFGAEPFFRAILENHSHLFSSTALTPDQLSTTEINTFIRILSYEKLLDGFHSLTIPTDPDILEITHRDFYYNRPHVKSQVETFTGATLTQAASEVYDQIAEARINNFFNSSALLLG